MDFMLIGVACMEMDEWCLNLEDRHRVLETEQESDPRLKVQKMNIHRGPVRSSRAGRAHDDDEDDD